MDSVAVQAPLAGNSFDPVVLTETEHTGPVGVLLFQFCPEGCEFYSLGLLPFDSKNAFLNQSM